jgi:hypothetical protein
MCRMLLTLFMLGLVVQPAPRAVAQDTSARTVGASRAQHLAEVGQLGGPVGDLVVQGLYTYVSMGPRLVIFDVSIPSRPTLVGQSAPQPGNLFYLAVANGHAYVATNQGGLRILHVGDPTNPVDVGFYPVAGPVPRVAVAGQYAYLTTREELLVLDVSNPANLVEVGRTAARGAVRLAVAGRYAYLAGSGLQIVDVSDPNSPRTVGSANVGRTKAVAVDSHYAYLITDAGHVLAVDVANPANPTAARPEGEGLGQLTDIAVAGRYAYVAAVERLFIVDLTDPVRPTRVGAVSTQPGQADRTVVVGDYAYVGTDYGGLRIVDVADPTSPVEIAAYHAPSQYPLDIAAAGGYAYVADGTNGLHIVDVSDPTHPRAVGLYYRPLSADRVAVVGQYAYVLFRGLGSERASLRVLDVRDAAQPREVTALALEMTDDLAVVGSHVYVATANGLRVLDVSDPAHPTEVGAYRPPPTEEPPDNLPVDRSARLAVAGRYAYIAFATSIRGGRSLQILESSSGLRVLDVADPTRPTEVGVYHTAWTVLALALVGPYAYMMTRGSGGTDYSRGIRVLDVSDPAHPTPVEFVPMATGSSSSRMVVAGRYAYLTAGGLRVLDVSDPLRPTQIASYRDQDINSIAVDGDYVYAGFNRQGLWILRFVGVGAGPAPTSTGTPLASPPASYP